MLYGIKTLGNIVQAQTQIHVNNRAPTLGRQDQLFLVMIDQISKQGKELLGIVLPIQN